MQCAARLLLVGLMAGIACWLLSLGVRLACVPVAAAWRRRRIQACCRAEVARALAEIERYLTDRAPQAPDSGNDPDP